MWCYIIVLLFCWTTCRVNSFTLFQNDCPEDYLQCQFGYNWRSFARNYCFDKKYLCDKNFDCSDGSDEKYCAYNYNYGYEGFAYHFVRGPCKYGHALCPRGKVLHPAHVQKDDYRCISFSSICDRFQSCEHSEEYYCPYDRDEGFQFTFDQRDCPPNHYRCRTGFKNNTDKHCILKSKICDGTSDCADYSDEIYCPYVFPTVENQSIPVEKQSIHQLIPATVNRTKELHVASASEDFCLTRVQVIIVVMLVVLLNIFVIICLAGLYYCRKYREKSEEDYEYDARGDFTNILYYKS